MEIQSNSINELVTALCKAQKLMKGAKLDGSNPHFKSKYATYESVRNACDDPLSDNGLAITHQLDVVDGKRVMVTQISHISGQWMRSLLMLPLDKETPQAIGSALSYSKRYSLSALLALGVDDGTDDDGETIEKPFRDEPKPKAASLPELITHQQAEELELMIGIKDAQYRSDLLKFFGNKLSLQINNFFELPKSCYDAALKSVKKRKEAKETESVKEDPVPF